MGLLSLAVYFACALVCLSHYRLLLGKVELKRFATIFCSATVKTYLQLLILCVAYAILSLARREGDPLVIAFGIVFEIIYVWRLRAVFNSSLRVESSSVK